MRRHLVQVNTLVLLHVVRGVHFNVLIRIDWHENRTDVSLIEKNKFEYQRSLTWSYNTQSCTALFRAFSSHHQPSAYLIRYSPAFFFWGGIFGNVRSLWDGSGSSLESCRHFFMHPQPLWVKVFPSWTRLLAELRTASLTNLSAKLYKP